MELALYHPQYGYYTSGRERIGRAGDFFTSVSVGPLFGKILARQFQQWGVSEVWEFGGHRGQLRADILAAAPNLAYHVIEAGDPLPEKLRGVVFSNEFLDALPVHRVQGDREVYVVARAACPFVTDDTTRNGRDARSTVFHEVLGPLSDPRLPRLPAGYRSELNLQALDWLADVARRLTGSAYILTIDYGFERAEYFSPHHAAGHLQCYYRHSKSADPYRQIGEQDITAHVEFTSLIEHGQRLGLEPVLFTDQAHYLLEMGEVVIADIVQRDAGKLSRERNAIHQLLHSTMGRAFKVLIQRKAV
jgi:SAM-dependent MidA family methyltransferase